LLVSFKYISAVEAVVLSGNGPSLIPVTGEPTVGAKGLSLEAENARLWLDRSAEKYTEEVSQTMGGYVDASFFLPKILMIKNEESKLYRQTKSFLGCPEYLACALTGEACTVFPSDGFDRWFWNDDVLEKFGLDADKFPPFIRPGGRFGTMLPAVAEHFGFKKIIPVISGGPDFFSAILGAGVIQPGQACGRTGSSDGINLCVPANVTDSAAAGKGLMSYGHPVKPYRNLSGTINTSGKAIEWASALLRLSSIDEFFKLAQESKPGSGGLVFRPYLAGERAPLWDASLRASWKGISLSSGRAEFANSVLEGICFAIRDVINVMEETGVTVSELRVTGRLAGNAYLNQLKANITGKEVIELVHKEAELTGLAIIGACSLGKFSSYTEAVSVFVKIEKSYSPERD
jgi:xylulokinase